MALVNLEPPEIAGCACDGYDLLDQNIEARAREVELVAIDLDGTLFTDEKTITPRTVAAIRAALGSGIHVVPATGRVLSILPAELFGVPGMEYAVGCAGACVMRLGADRAASADIHETGMKSDEAADLVHKLVARFGASVFVDVVCRGTIYTAVDQVDHLDRTTLDGRTQAFVRRTRRVMPNLVDGVRALPGPIGHINLFYTDREVRFQLMAWLAKHTDYELSNSLGWNIEINAAGTSKWNGICWLAAHLGVRADRVLAIGDSANDVDMISHAWLGVAMCNAEPGIRARAQAQTAYDNNHEGVARMLEELVELKRD